jgi:pimeloyl-ACP methyl ester carboxylesterase
MEKFRTYGTAPYKIAVVHGGPGAPGEMAPVARELAHIAGVIEPFQTADTVEKQIEELRVILERTADVPVTLVGYSWGAWLSFIVASRYQSLVDKLVLISSGPFEEKYARGVMETRLNRLSDAEKKDVMSFVESFDSSTQENMDEKMAHFGQLISKADAFDPLPHATDIIGIDFHVFQCVWKGAEQLRRSGELLKLAQDVQCPVVAVHGAHDPHPAEGVQKPLSRVLKDFRFVLLQNCGHTPWIERQARDEFFRILKRECK